MTTNDTDDELVRLREEVRVLREVQAGAFNGDRNEIGAGTSGLLDSDLARVSAHLRLCSGSSALPPRAQQVYRELAEACISVLHMRRADLRELAGALDLGPWEAEVQALLNGDLGEEEKP